MIYHNELLKLHTQLRLFCYIKSFCKRKYVTKNIMSRLTLNCHRSKFHEIPWPSDAGKVTWESSVRTHTHTHSGFFSFLLMYRNSKNTQKDHYLLSSHYFLRVSDYTINVKDVSFWERCTEIEIQEWKSVNSFTWRSSCNLYTCQAVPYGLSLTLKKTEIEV